MNHHIYRLTAANSPEEDPEYVLMASFLMDNDARGFFNMVQPNWAPGWIILLVSDGQIIDAKNGTKP